MSASKFGLASLAGAGSIGGGFGIYKLYTENRKSNLTRTIADKLRSEKFSLLGRSTEDAKHWQDIKGEYEKKKNSSEAFSSSAQLEDICLEVLTKPETDSDYQKAKRWCVTPVTISEHLNKFNLKALNTSDTTDQAAWTNKVTEYEKQENANKRISDLATLNESSKWEQIRNKCKTITSKKSYEDSFSELLDKSKLWCFTPLSNQH
ncbi:hypothetical protein MHC_03700 [Mycoplasma haemocanis str. Illinois]|uniref:Uncharacterized protein n=1 Tax=Mycoplasma haemocanis (strain Illinois) TaxID=1111676 RepID=H6N7H8_MYCHN|nr:hypothetical protein [Mycoplasma haemocanis]AEW45600.1 hypothetical protein MHC_03700 [Mycoplasma haemocanis str. Illinois]